MAPMNRRDLLAGLSALAATGAPAQLTAPPGETLLGTPKIYPFADLPMKKNPNGSETRSVLHGTLLTGESIEVHESTLLPGAAPNPPHAHRQSDLMFVRQGTIAFEHDGQSEHLGPGGVILVPSQTTHTIRNVGETTATYFVIIIGRDHLATPA